MLEKQSSSNARVFFFNPVVHPWKAAFKKELSKYYTVEWLARGQYGNYPFDELNGEYVTYERSNRITSALVLVRQFMKFRPHSAILFANESEEGILLAILSKLLGIRFVMVVEENSRTINKDFMLRLLRFFKENALRLAYRSSSTVVAESEASRDYVISYYHIDASKVRVIHHGVDTTIFGTSRLDSNCRESLQLSANDFVVLFINALQNDKGIRVLYDAVLLTSSESSSLAPVYLVPLARTSDKGELHENSKLFDDPKIHRFVRRYSPRPPSGILELYSVCDIVVLPALKNPLASSERSSNTILEALACGKPVVATRVGGIPTFVGECGVLVPSGDAKSLANAILLLQRDRLMRERISGLCAERVSKDLSMASYAKMITEILEDNS